MWDALQSLAIGLLAPLGLLLGWWLQRKDKTGDRLHARNELLRQKAEEIFAETKRVEERMQAAIMQAIEDAHNAPRTVPETISLIRMDRLKTLLRMYFPESDELLEGYTTRLNGALNPSRQVTGAPAHPDPATHLRNLREARLASAQQCTEITIEMMTVLRHFMVGQTRNLV